MVTPRCPLPFERSEYFARIVQIQTRFCSHGASTGLERKAACFPKFTKVGHTDRPCSVVQGHLACRVCPKSRQSRTQIGPRGLYRGFAFPRFVNSHQEAPLPRGRPRPGPWNISKSLCMRRTTITFINLTNL
jgi:hypothetical protein